MQFKPLFLFILSSLILNSCGNENQQTSPAGRFKNVREVRIDSEVLDEERLLYVYLPKDYQEKNYDLLFLIDGEYPDIFGEALKSFEDTAMEERIIVGIDNHLNRNRDLIPEKIAARPGSGEADKFLDFVTKELMPYVEQHYSTSQNRILFGGSNGGLFTLYAMFTQPEYFSSFISSSAMVGHCPELMYRLMEEQHKKETLKGKRLFIHYGMQDQFTQATDFLPQYSKTLKQRYKEFMTIKIVELPDGGHVPLEGIPEGLQFVTARE